MGKVPYAACCLIIMWRRNMLSPVFFIDFHLVSLSADVVGMLWETYVLLDDPDDLWLCRVTCSIVCCVCVIWIWDEGKWRLTPNFDIHPFAGTSLSTDSKYCRSHTLIKHAQLPENWWFGLVVRNGNSKAQSANPFGNSRTRNLVGPQTANQTIDRKVHTKEMWTLISRC